MIIAASLHLIFAISYLGLVLSALSARRPWLAMSIFAFGTAWLLFYRSILKWIAYLGSDSFSEAQSFDLTEAWTFLETTTQVLERDSLVIVAATLFAGSLAVFSIHAAGRHIWRSRWNPNSMAFSIGALAIVAGTWILQIYPAFGAFRWNSQYYQGIYDNFHAHTDLRLASDAPLTHLNVIVHIGESTTSMNMGIYGYMRPTTPELESFAASNGNLLVFHNVLSTHTHTAPSLLEALSIGVDTEEDFLPISERRRTSVIDLLKQAGIPTALISNQGQTGSWNNLASTVVFRNVDWKEFSFSSAWMGEMEHFASRPLDHEFLLPALERGGQLDRPGPTVVFLHSYAGHSPYWRNIAPEFRTPVDDLMARLPETAIVGAGITNRQHTIRRLDQYDSVIRYVDHLTTSVLQRVQASPHPAVYIYLSDHGEAAYAGRGHDSSRFLHEMARVPLLVYFNDAAALAHPDLVARFHEASRTRRISTLAQLPASLLSLYGQEVEGDGLRGIGLDKADSLPPILTRETTEGFRYIALGARQPGPEGYEGFAELRDAHTRIFRASRHLEDREPAFCIQRAHSVGKAVRGSIIAECIHAQVSIGPDGRFSVASPGTDGNAISLDILYDIIDSYSTYLILSVNNIPRPDECAELVRLLGDNRRYGQSRGLVMFPAEALEPEVIHGCIQPLRQRTFDTGIELPMELAWACSESSADRVHAGAPCESLRAFMMEAERSGAFSDLGIRFNQSELIESLGRNWSFAWTALDVPVEALDDLQYLPVQRLVVESVHDPNDL